MDIVINAAIQSPLFRNLSHIPADRLAFSHHITSNAPPLSKTKITVMPATMHNSLDADYQFRIPQFGFLNKVILRLEYDITPCTRFQVTPLLPLYHMIQEISLRTHHKPIQTIYGKEMLVKHAYFSELSDKGAKFLGTLNPPPRPGVIDLGNMFRDPATGKPYDPVADSGQSETRKRRVVMMVEVPLASTEAPHVNFDTRFVEHLDLYVKLVSTNGGDVPIGMAAGLMEQDLSQDFNVLKAGGVAPLLSRPIRQRNKIYVQAGTGFTQNDAFPAQLEGPLFTEVNPNTDGTLNYVRGDGGYVDADQVCHLVKITDRSRDCNLGLGTTNQNADATAFSYAIALVQKAPVVDNDNTHGDGVYIFGIPNNQFTDALLNQDAQNTLTTLASVNNSTHADAAAATHISNHFSGSCVLEVLGPVRVFNNELNPLTYAALDAADVALRLGTTLGIQPSVGTLLQLGMTTEHMAEGAAHVAPSVTTVDSEYSRANILNFKTELSTTIANSGPIIAPRDDCVNAVGSPEDPILPINWVRVGTSHFDQTQYAKWQDGIKCDWYNDATDFADGGENAFTHSKTLIKVRRTLAMTETNSTFGPTNPDNGSKNPDYSTGVRAFNVGTFTGKTTAGGIAKKAMLERYYSLYPHLHASGTRIRDMCNTRTETEEDSLKSNTSLDYPQLLGGRATNATTLTYGSGNSCAVPENIGLSLSCTFLNYHDKIREDIATENFKDNAPATILQYDTQQEIVNAKYGSSSSSYALNPYDEMVVHLKSNHLAYAISILAFRDKTPAELAASTARDSRSRSISMSSEPINDFGCVNTGGVDASHDSNCTFPCYQVVENFKTVKPTYVAVKGSGRPIYECGIDATPQANGLNAEFCPKSAGGGRIPGAGNCLSEADLDNLSFNYNRTEGHGSLQGPEAIPDGFLTGVDKRITGEFADHCSAHVISWGLNTTDQLANSGSLALQTINQPTLHLRFPEKCRVYVYVHHFSMIQIDANTGSISKSLDV